MLSRVLAGAKGLSKCMEQGFAKNLAKKSTLRAA
jgi:hypothetical protein